MTRGESDLIWLRWLNSMIRRGRVLAVPAGEFSDRTPGVRLDSPDVHLHVTWPSVEFCMFGADPRLPHYRYTSIFEMAHPGWKYYDDVWRFAVNNQWMKSYTGCASREELALRASINGDDPDGLLQRGSRLRD